MIHIGIFLNRLKKIKVVSRGANLLIVTLVVVISANGWARSLSPTEVNKLENNIKIDPQNTLSAQFLIQHYFTKKQWGDLIRVAQPQQKNLNLASLRLLLEAYLSVEEGLSAQNILGQIHGTVGATAETKILEARAMSLIAKKEKTQIQKMNYANAAIQVIRGAVELDPHNEDIYIEWVDILRSFWPQFAQDALNVVKVMEQKTKNYESHIPLKCELFTKAALWDQGSLVCQRAIRANPKDVMSHLYFSEVQSVKIGIEEKKKILEKLIQNFPKQYEVQKALADLYFDEQNYTAAAVSYRKLVELNGDNLESILRLAQSEFHTKQFLLALESYKKHCKGARMIASEFRDATKQLRSDPNLHKYYDDAIQSCR